MRTTLIVLALAAALTTSTRANAQGANLPLFTLDSPVVLGMLLGPPALVTTSTLVMDSILIAQLASGRTPTLGLAIANLVLSTLSGAWNALGLANMTPQLWQELPGLPLAFATGLALNASTLALSIVTLTLPRTPPVALVPMVLPSGGGASIAVCW